MLFRRVILPIVALALAGVTAIYARGWIEGQRAQPAQSEAVQPPETVGKMVLVAASNLPRGSFIQPGSLRWQEWPDVDLPETYFLSGETTEEDLIGAVVRNEISLGEPVTGQMVVMPGDRGFLAAVLNPDMRAVTVPVDEASGNAGLVFPGDHVDLILTQTLGGSGEMEETRRVSETVLQDLRVIAMGRLVSSEGAEDSLGREVRTATLEVDASQAEMVALVTELGKLSLSLRSLAKAQEDKTSVTPLSTTRRFTWDSDVAEVLRPENQPLSRMAVMRGQEKELIDVQRGAAK